MTKRNYFIAIICLIILAFINYYRIFSFGFWKDDWISWWGSYFKSPLFFSYWYHPGNTLEFILLPGLFPANSLGWQIVGFMARVFAAISVLFFISALSKSKRTGILAGLIFVSTPIGLDTVGWASVHVVNIAIGLVCIGFYFWISNLNFGCRTQLLLSIIILTAGILSDPFRALPVIIFLYISLYFFRTTESKKIKMYFHKSLIVIFPMIFGLLYWERIRISEISVVKFFNNPHFSTGLLAHKLYVTGNYFNSIFNLLAGWIVPVYEYLSTAEYSRWQARIGLILIILIGVYILILKRKKSKDTNIVLFFYLWMLVFYFPSWLSEPRLTMGITHRYMVFAGVGSIGLTAYFINLIRNKNIFIIIFSAVLCLNIFDSQKFLTKWQVFRSRTLIDSIWNQILRESGPVNRNKVFLISGSHSVVTNTLNYSGITPYTVYLKVGDANNIPIYTDNLNAILPNYCSGKFEIDNLYSWEINNLGSVKNTTIEIRKKVNDSITANNCQVNAKSGSK
jgi:hypothetical protein